MLEQHRPLEEGKASPLEWARLLFFERVDQPGWQGPPKHIVERDVTRLAQAIDAFMRLRAPGATIPKAWQRCLQGTPFHENTVAATLLRSECARIKVDELGERNWKALRETERHGLERGGACRVYRDAMKRGIVPTA